MSNETIHYRCGHTGIVNLFGKTSERARKAKWLGESRVCEECAAKERAAANAAAAEANTAAGLSPLRGTLKQISWAESIRKERIAEMETGGRVVDLQRRHNAAQSDDERRLILREDKMVSRSYQVQEALSRLRTPERYDAFVAFLKAQDEASWWIDWNQASLASIIERHAEQLDKVERTAKPVAAEIKEIAREEMAEAVLKPAGEPVAATIAEIRRAGDAIEVKFPEKRDDFRKTIKAMGYLWENCWRKKLSDKTGDPIDRLAEVAHRLVATGFAVRLHHNEARVKAISGQFEPEQMRWISECTAGKYAGSLMISWGRDDDLYDVARSLPGARYVKPCIVVPAGAIEAVAEFAECYDFRISPGAIEILEQHRTALAAGAVITDIKERPQNVKADYCSTPRPLEVPTYADIEDELRD